MNPFSENWIVCLIEEGRSVKTDPVEFGSVIEEKGIGESGPVSHIMYVWTNDIDKAKTYESMHDAKMAARFKYPKKSGHVKFITTVLFMQDEYGNWVPAGVDSLRYLPRLVVE